MRVGLQFFFFFFVGGWTRSVPLTFLVAGVDGWKCVCVPQ